MDEALDFLQRMYLPGYMVVEDCTCSSGSARFTARPVEPQVTALSDEYLTPRGGHIILSQMLYLAFQDMMVGEGRRDNGVLENLGFAGQLVLTGLNYRFKKKIPLDENIPGEIRLTRFRPGSHPVFYYDFDLANGSVVGSTRGMVAPLRSEG